MQQDRVITIPQIKAMVLNLYGCNSKTATESHPNNTNKRCQAVRP